MSQPDSQPWQPPRGDGGFAIGLWVLVGGYLLLIALMLAADVGYAFGKAGDVLASLLTPEIRYALWLSLLSSAITAFLSLWVAVPAGYLLSRTEFPGKSLVDGLLDVPIFLPPIVVGLSLLLLFRQTPLAWLDDRWPIALNVPAVILAQFAVSAAFAARAMKATFDEIPVRHEQVALTLGASRWQAFTEIVLPAAWRGLLTAGTLAWARALGEFGPVLIFAGSTRFKTEVLPVSIHLQLSVGNIEGAVGVSILLVIVALATLLIVRSLGGSCATPPGVER